MNKTIFTKSHRYLVGQLTAARKQAKLKQKDVARKLDRTQSYVSKIEAGQRRVDIVQLEELAEIYKKKINFFIK